MRELVHLSVGDTSEKKTYSVILNVFLCCGELYMIPVLQIFYIFVVVLNYLLILSTFPWDNITGKREATLLSWTTLDPLNRV